MRVRRLALIFLLTLMAPAIQAWPSEVLTASAGGAGISLLSKSQWSEAFTDSNHLSYHLVGEVRNDTGANVSGVALQLNLYDSLGNYKGSHTTPSTVRVLAPGERSPFEYVLFTPPPDYKSFTVTQPIPFAVSVGRPDHNFITTPDPCPPPPDCQGHVNGSVQNPNSAPPVQGVGVIFTFYDGTGAIVSQNRLDISNAAGGTSLAPGETGRFVLDRTTEPTWSSKALMVEPDYPIDVNPTSLNFGNKRLGVTSATEDVAVFNSGSDPITIASATASGDFAVAGFSCTTIAPLSRCRVSITFTPTGMGARTGTLTITENVAGSPQVIPLGGTGVAPVLTLDTTTLNFGPQAVGTTSAAKTVTITNTGTDTLNISAMSTSGDYASSTCPASLAPSAYCVVSITFSPMAGGPRNGTLTIQDDAAGSPHTVQLSGTGLGPGVAFSPPGLDFGPVSMGSTSGGRTVQLTNSGSAALTITSIAASGDFQSTDNCPRGPATLAASASCTITVTFTPTAPGARTGTLTVTDNAGDSPQQYSLKGLGAKSTYTAVITTQAHLTSSDGATWQPIDPALALTIKLPDSEAALLSGNADLWTAARGVNQDLGITVSVGGGPDTLLFWKESGGFAGTFSPNAAFVHGFYQLQPGFTYVFKLVWKTNNPAPGASIFAGAGPIGPDYSPTRLTVQLVQTPIVTAVINSQPQLTSSDGTTWSDIDPALTVSFSGSLGTSAVIAGNADLWTATAGVNQDVAIIVTPPGQLPQVVAWKESGGSAGTFSPNAAFVQAIVPTSSIGTYQVSLKWKTNVNTHGSTIVAGAGAGPKYSPTTLTVQQINTQAANSTLTTRQSTLAGSDGAVWSPLASLSITQPSSTANAVAVVGANADLWTNTTGYNQDLGIFLSIDDGPDVLVGWKESGGYAGIFSPNAAYVQAVVPMPANHKYRFSLQWKTNKPEGSATIAAGAGPIGPAYSPTSLSVQITPN
jgi:centrosomal CEP192-like protein/ASPM-SPD-2-Hydin domain-containing protein